MGASGWYYFTPLRGSVARSLEVLRRRVFECKEYGSPAQHSWDAMSPAERDDAMRELLDAIPPEQREPMRALVEYKLTERGEAPEPASIEELLERRGEDGTHSILDISRGLSEAPEFAAAFPMPDSVKRDLYGTIEPTRPQVEGHAMERNEQLERWQCWYVLVYKDGRPEEVYFEGCSGD
jgi:hypothetical protein